VRFLVKVIIVVPTRHRCFSMRISMTHEVSIEREIAKMVSGDYERDRERPRVLLLQISPKVGSPS
jgi:hypothetical protein